MAHHVRGVELQHPHPLDPVQNPQGVGKAGIARVQQVDLRRIARHDHPRPFAQTGQHHLHLQTARVLGFIDDDEGVAEGAAAHEGDGGGFDLALVAAALHVFGAQDVVQRLPDRGQIRVDLLVQIAGQKAQLLACLDRRAGDDQPVHLSAPQQGRAIGRRQKCLAGARRSDAEGQFAPAQHVQIGGLGLGLGHDGAALAARQGYPGRRHARRAFSAARLAQGGAHIGLGDLGAQGRALGQILDHPAGVGSIARAAVDRDPAARRLDQYLEGVLDQGDVAAVRPDDRAQFSVIQRYELGLSRHQAAFSDWVGAAFGCWGPWGVTSRPCRLFC